MDRRRTFLEEAAEHAEQAQQVIDAALERARARVIDLRDPAPTSPLSDESLPAPREAADDEAGPTPR